MRGPQGVTGRLSDSLLLCCPIPHPVSLDSVLGDVRSLQRGLELTQREFVRQDDCTVLKEFLRANSPTMDKLLADSKTAQVGQGWLGPGGGEAGDEGLGQGRSGERWQGVWGSRDEAASVLKAPGAPRGRCWQA